MYWRRSATSRTRPPLFRCAYIRSSLRASSTDRAICLWFVSMTTPADNILDNNAMLLPRCTLICAIVTTSRIGHLWDWFARPEHATELTAASAWFWSWLPLDSTSECLQCEAGIATHLLSFLAWLALSLGRQGFYCLDLLCLLTNSAVRRIRFLMATCSLRARASISATSSCVGAWRRAMSASASHRAVSSGLGLLTLWGRSSGGWVGRGGSSALAGGFFGTPKKNATIEVRSSIQNNAYTCLSSLWKSLWKVCTRYIPTKIELKMGPGRSVHKNKNPTNEGTLLEWRG